MHSVGFGSGLLAEYMAENLMVFWRKLAGFAGWILVYQTWLLVPI
jgi:hypothetical protein